MTVTANEKAVQGGISVPRVYTKEGVHPYETVAWERTDVVMTNHRDGSVNFAQYGVEFPSTWSLNARSIVTSKYFRGKQGTPDREWSLKQVIDRVADTYANAGIREGYFATDADAEVFRDELKYMLLHQIFSFNSPVWFNVGTKSPQQVSACQPYGALVSTPAGLIPIGQLVEEDAVGAKVYDARGVTSVVATKANGVKDVLRIHTKAGHALDVTADHLVWRSNGSRMVRDSLGNPILTKFVPAGELKPGDQLEWHRRAAFGEAEVHPQWIAEAALAGWMQSDGCVAQYPGSGNPSLIFEAMTVNDDELQWVRQAIDFIWPDAIIHKPVFVKTQDTSLDCRRTRMSGKYLESFAEDWGLRARGTAQVVPQRLFTAPLPVVAAYLRSLFQAEGYVSPRKRSDGSVASTYVGLGMVSEELIRGVQSLLARFGIFARVSRHVEKRENRHDLWVIGIQSAGDRRIFADEIGFISADKAAKLEASFDIPGRPALDVKRLEIARIEHLGPQEVFDIQTESGEYLSGSLRVHNCFLLAVEDDMEEILNWYKEEGLIFRRGSGAGVNLSRLRGSRELLSTGGCASGPVSFMRGADSSAGSIASGGSTRRAAKLVCLDVDHPDVLQFVEVKAKEERKIRALRDAGFDMDLGGEDASSVHYQNANNSVRVTDEFMRAVQNNTKFDLINRVDGSVAETVDARALFAAIAQAAWECADPGLQYDDTINAWHTCPESGRITTSNPCSEYMHLDNSSCNLASLNLLKFLTPDLDFDSGLFAKAVEIVITAMDISICFADFPTEKIAQTSRDYRQLGIGYSNLGALLMAMGRAYDSEGGRALAASITSLMSAVSYQRSSLLAAALGAYNGYARNVASHIDVLARHAGANDQATHSSVGLLDGRIFEEAGYWWEQALEVARADGVRNAQVSLLAPTGTISFMMDCDTTGVEPDFMLKKYKKLHGGGSMEIVNETVPMALRNLGYSAEQIEAIVSYISANNSVVGAPALAEKHYEVFDCAMGNPRFIAPMGHVLMMAAVQPFLSGAISKTINMPESATVEQIADVYFKGWELGLKAIAIYRDGCKAHQPLNTGTSAKTPVEPVADVVQSAPATPTRRRLPARRRGLTTSFTVGGADGYLTASDAEDGSLGEIFLKLGKQGSTLAGVMDAFSIAVSIGLQYGIPLETFVEKFTGMQFEPRGMTSDSDVRLAASVLDYVFRRLAIDYISRDDREAMGILSVAERTEALAPVAESIETSTPAAAPAEPPHVVSSGFSLEAPLCGRCGVSMRRAGVCWSCVSCGDTSGCS